MAAPMRHGMLVARFCSYTSPYRCAAGGNGKILRNIYLARLLCGLRLQSTTAGSDSGSDSDQETTAKGKKSKLNLAKPVKKQRTPAVKPAKEEIPKSEPSLEQQMVSAVETVAQSLGGDTEKTQSDLLKQLQKHASLTETQKQGKPPHKSTTVQSVFSGMKVEGRRTNHRGRGQRRPVTEEWENLGTQHLPGEKSIIGEMMREQRPGMMKVPKSQDDQRRIPKLFDGPGLNIFHQPGETPKDTKAVAETRAPSLFDRVAQEELDQLIKLQPVTNAWEEAIRWTEGGQLWKFPRDNEQGMDEEANIGFHEHVFLDHLIEDFAAKGPIRHFMELVVVGLSQNPYLTVQQKQEHLDWFRNYFNEKEQVIAEAMRDATVASQ